MKSPILFAAATLVALGIAAERADARTAGFNLPTHTVRSDSSPRADHMDSARHLRPHFTLGYLGPDGWHPPSWVKDVDRTLPPHRPHPHFILGYLGPDGWHPPSWAKEPNRNLPPLACRGRPGGC